MVLAKIPSTVIASVGVGSWDESASRSNTHTIDLFPTRLAEAEAEAEAHRHF